MDFFGISALFCVFVFCSGDRKRNGGNGEASRDLGLGDICGLGFIFVGYDERAGVACQRERELQEVMVCCSC